MSTDYSSTDIAGLALAIRLVYVPEWHPTRLRLLVPWAAWSLFTPATSAAYPAPQHPADGTLVPVRPWWQQPPRFKLPAMRSQKPFLQGPSLSDFKIKTSLPPHSTGKTEQWSCPVHVFPDCRGICNPAAVVNLALPFHPQIFVLGPFRRAF